MLNIKFTCCNCGKQYTPSSEELECVDKKATNLGGICNSCYVLLSLEPSIKELA